MWNCAGPKPAVLLSLTAARRGLGDTLDIVATMGVTYWESRYEDRHECMEIEGASLRADEWDPDVLDETLDPI
jgi:hypothetical protein